jgi:hypothetical protein
MSLSDLNELSANAVQVPQTQTFSARVARDADGFAPVDVIIPEFDPFLTFGPAPWVPVVQADGIYYPKEGDRALVVRPSELEIWIAAWQPTATEADACRWFADFEESE